MSWEMRIGISLIALLLSIFKGLRRVGYVFAPTYAPYAISTFPIMYLSCPQNNCISIVFNFFWGGYNTQEK